MSAAGPGAPIHRARHTTAKVPTSPCSPKWPNESTLVLLDGDGASRTVTVTEVDGFVWHCYLPGAGPGHPPDSAGHTLLGVVTDPAFDRGG